MVLISFYDLQLNVEPWGPLVEWTPTMVRSRPISLRRVLLRGLDYRVWYLGERVRGWHVGSHMRCVPVSHPRGMFHAYLLRGDTLNAACVGEDADEL